MSGPGSGDKLARGAHSATFEAPKVSQEKWDEMWGGPQETGPKKNYNPDGEESPRIDTAMGGTVAPAAKAETSSKPPRLRPLFDRVIVRRIEEEDKVNGLFIPDDAKEKPSRGLVVAVGGGRVTDSGVTVRVSVNVGDKVMFGKYGGTVTKLDGEELLILREEELFGVLEPEAVVGDHLNFDEGVGYDGAILRKKI